MGVIFPSRTWQERIFIFLVFVGASLMILGIYTLHISPLLSIDSGFQFYISEPNIQKIEEIKLPPAFHKILPEFFTPKEEADWRQMHERLYRLLMEKDTALIEIMGKDGITTRMETAVGLMPFSEAIKRTGLIYLAALIYIISAFLVFKRHPSVSGSLLTFFLVSTGLYFISSAPVVSRVITLYPPYFKILISFLYISAGGMITLVHFAFIFPKPKEILKRHPWIPYLFYVYFLITLLLYLSGTTAFGTFFPFFAFWTIVMIGAFIHSLFKEKDPFLRKQITLSLLAPLMVGSIFVFFYLLPGVLGMIPMRPTHLALFSLILPFALPFVMDNLSLYQTGLEMGHKSQQEKEQIRQELHDSILCSLADISLFSEVSLNLLDEEMAGVREKLHLIQDLAKDSSQELRDFLWFTDEDPNTWEDLCGRMRRYGHELTKHLDIDLNLHLSEAGINIKSPPLSVRVCLYQVFREAIHNVIKHANADKIKISLSFIGDNVILEMEDNGAGFNLGDSKEGHYGLKNMKRRADTLGGAFNIKSRIDQGTHIELHLPLI